LPYEYQLIPLSSVAVFDDAALEEMAAYWHGKPLVDLVNGTFMLFHDEASRTVGLARARSTPPMTDYLTALVRLGPSSVDLRAVDDDTDERLYEFVLWVQSRWPSELRFAGQAVGPEALRPSDEDET
jgi:hypothetical protein